MLFKLKNIQYNRVLILTILVFIGNLIAITTCLINSKILGLDYPYNTYLFLPSDRFMDFFNPLSVSLAPYQQITNHWQHMPFYYTLISTLRIFPPRIAFYLVVCVFIAFFVIFFLKATYRISYWKSALCVIILFSSYPVVFAIDRGNFEMMFFILLFSTVILISKKQFILATLVTSIAMSFKPFGIFLLPLFIYKKRYWECLLIPLFTLLISYFSIRHFPGSVAFNYHHWMQNVSLYKTHYNLGVEGIINGCSIWGAIKQMILSINYPLPLDTINGLKEIAHLYFYSAAALTVLIIYFVVRFPSDFWKKLTLLICCMNMFPLTTADYRLLHFFIPLYFWLSQNDKNTNHLWGIRFDYIYLLLFALILIPRNYYHFGGTPVTSAVYTSPLIMIIFTIVIFVDCYITNRDKWQEPKLQLEPSAS